MGTKNRKRWVTATLLILLLPLPPFVKFNSGATTPYTIGVRDRDEYGSGLKPILAGPGLDRTAIFLKIGVSGLDRTEKNFVLMRLFRTKKF